MDEERKMYLFYAIAEMAAEHGMNLSLELKDKKSSSTMFKGTAWESSSDDRGLELRANHSSPAPAPEDEDQEDDQEEDDEEPAPEPYEEIDGVKYYADGEVGSDG